MNPRAAQRASGKLTSLATAGLDVVSFFHEAAEVIDVVVPSSDRPCWTTVDPASLLITGTFHDGEVETPHEWFVLEYLEDDVNKTADVARSQRGYSTLADATGGDLTRSRMYRDFLQPMGMEHHLIVALRTRNGDAWGALDLVRSRDEITFTADEIEFLRMVAPALAEGVRRGMLVGEASDPDGPESPGLVVLDEGWNVESMTPGVGRWLESMPGDGEVPTAVLTVAAMAVRTAEGTDEPGEVAIARVLSNEGRWIVLHGAALVTNGSRRAAVIVEPAHPARITPLLMAAYGLTEREQDVTRLVLCGESTSQIARELHVSPHTVQQHLKSVFDKTNVRSRRELVGKVFFSHYEPRVRDNERRVAVDQPARGGPFPLKRG